MNDITPHINKAASDVRLARDERARLSRVIHEYVAMKPLPREAQHVVSIRRFSIAWVHRPLAAAVALVVLFGGGVSFAAESALPGDALYLVKTKVNEPVKVALAAGAEAQANVQIELAERRIEEAAALAAERRLDAQTQQSLAAAFEAHARSATEEVQAINGTDSSAAAEISSRFETRLAAHQAVLSLVANGATETLTDAIHGAGLAVASVRARAEEDAAVSAPMALAASFSADAAPMAMMMKAAPAPAADQPAATSAENETQYDSRAARRMQGAAEDQLKAVKKSLRSADLDAEGRAEAQSQIDESEDLIDAGRGYLKNDAAPQAYHAFQDSLVISEKLDVLLSAGISVADAQRGASRGADLRARIRSGAAFDEPMPGETATASPAEDAPPEATTSPSEEWSPIPPPLQIFVPHEGEGATHVEIHIGL